MTYGCALPTPVIRVSPSHMSPRLSSETRLCNVKEWKVWGTPSLADNLKCMSRARAASQHPASPLAAAARTLQSHVRADRATIWHAKPPAILLRVWHTSTTTRSALQHSYLLQSYGRPLGLRYGRRNGREDRTRRGTGRLPSPVEMVHAIRGWQMGHDPVPRQVRPASLVHGADPRCLRPTLR